MHARGVGHVLVDHLDDAERRHLRGEAEPAADARRPAHRAPRRHPAASCRRRSARDRSGRAPGWHRSPPAPCRRGRSRPGRDRRRRSPARRRCGPSYRHARSSRRRRRSPPSRSPGSAAAGRSLCGTVRRARPRRRARSAACQSSIRQIFAVVPPMSKDSTLAMPHCRAMVAEKIAPPAGPLSTRRIGKRHAVSIVVSPPPDSIRNSGPATPMLAQPVCQARADSVPSAAAHRRWRRWWRSAPTRASPARPRWTAIPECPAVPRRGCRARGAHAPD